MSNFKVSAWQAIQSLSNVQQVVKFSVGCFRKYALDRITKQNLSHSQWRISHCWHAAVVLFWLLIVAFFYCKNSLCKKSFCKNNGVAMEVGWICSPVSLPEHCKYVWVILIPTFSCSEYPPRTKKIDILSAHAFLCFWCQYNATFLWAHRYLYSITVPFLSSWQEISFVGAVLICILLGCCVDMKRYTNSIFYCTVKGTLVCVNNPPPPRSIFCLSFSANLCYLDVYYFYF